MIEGFVFVEDHENIFYRRAQAFDRLFSGQARLRLRRFCPVPVKWHDIASWIGLQGHHWLVRFLRQIARGEAKLRHAAAAKAAQDWTKNRSMRPPIPLVQQAEVWQFPFLTMLGWQASVIIRRETQKK